jgi:hypothetical protein
MPGSARQRWYIRCLLFVVCLLFTPPLDALDGHTANLAVVSPGYGITAIEKSVPLASVPAVSLPPILGRPLLHPLILRLPTRRFLHRGPTRYRLFPQVMAGTGDADAGPA